MAIRFRCTTCNKLLQTADSTAGRQVKCPSCATLLTIPHASTADVESQGPPPPPGDVFGAQKEVNPYESPRTQWSVDQVVGPGRTGPPWERDGASFGSFVATLKDAYTKTGMHFSTMRREGGLGYPIFYNIAGNLAGTIVAVLYMVAIYAVFGSIAFMGGGMGDMGVGEVGAAGGILAVGMVLYFILLLVAVPMIATVSAFIGGGILHLMLMMVGGATRPFETTFRAYCYASGSAVMVALIPFCGNYLVAIPLLVFLVWGLMNLHEIPLWKSLLAVLLPAVICTVICCGGYAAIMFAAMQADPQLIEAGP